MGILDRAKEVASRKKHEAEAAIEKEKRYASYKHPDLDFIVHGQRPYGPQTKAQSEESEEFSQRHAKEKETHAKRVAYVKEKARGGAKWAAEKGEKAGRHFVKKMTTPVQGRHPAERAFGPPRQRPPQDDFGFGGGMGSSSLEMFGTPHKQSHPLDMGFGGKSINPLGSRKGKQIRIW
jgi:hypothetical protein